MTTFSLNFPGVHTPLETIVGRKIPMKHIKRIDSAVCILAITAMVFSGCGMPQESPVSSHQDVSLSDQIMDHARVSYLGPEGTYTEEAAQFFFPDAESFIPEASVPEAIDDIKAGTADLAVIPQENTIGGAVTNYIDALIAEDGVFVTGEVILPINQTLMGVPGTKLSDITTICSQFVHLSLKSTPTLVISQSLLPHGCTFFVLTISPILYSIITHLFHCINCSYEVQEESTKGNFICHQCENNTYRLTEYGTCQKCYKRF